MQKDAICGFIRSETEMKILLVRKKREITLALLTAVACIVNILNITVTNQYHSERHDL